MATPGGRAAHPLPAKGTVGRHTPQGQVSGQGPQAPVLLMLPALPELASGSPAQGWVGQKAEPVGVLGSGRRPGGSFPGVSPLSSPSAPSQARPLHSLHGDGRDVLALLRLLWGLEELLCLWALAVLL